MRAESILLGVALVLLVQSVLAARTARMTRSIARGRRNDGFELIVGADRQRLTISRSRQEVGEGWARPDLGDSGKAVGWHVVGVDGIDYLLVAWWCTWRSCLRVGRARLITWRSRLRVGKARLISCLDGLDKQEDKKHY